MMGCFGLFVTRPCENSKRAFAERNRVLPSAVFGAVIPLRASDDVANAEATTENGGRAELQADYFAGFILKKLGAPLADVQLAMAMVSSDQATDSHPAKALHVAEVRKGWEAAAHNVGANVIPATLTVPDRSTFAPAAPARVE
jgi:hypothetical protein